MPPAQKLVLLRLADTARDDGAEAWRAGDRMRKETGLSERTVRTALRGLEDAGLIDVMRPADPARWLTTVYRLKMPADFKQGSDTPGAAVAPPWGDNCPTPPAAVAPPLGQDAPHPGAAVAPSPYKSPNYVSEEGANAPSAREAPPPENDLLIAEEPAKPATDAAEHMLSIWAEELKGIVPVPRKLDAAMRKAAKARLKDSCGGSLEAWHEACRKIAASRFLTGGGKQGWRATFKWMLKPDSLERLASGEFDDNRPAGPRSLMDTMAEVKADMEAEAAGQPRKRKSDAAERFGPGIRWAMGQQAGDRMADGFSVFDNIRNQGAPDNE